MRLTFAKIVLMLLLIALPISGYLMGYQKAAAEERKQVVTRLMYEYAVLHQSAVETSPKNNTLNMLLLGSTRNYQALFPNDAKKNKSPLYDYAVRTSKEIEAALVPISNIAPGVKIKLTEPPRDGA